MDDDGVDDADLLRRIRGGEAEAYGALFERHAEALRARVERQLPAAVRRKVSVADIVQEARIVAYRRLPDFEHRDERSFRNWLFRIGELKVKGVVERFGAAKRAAGREVSRSARPDTAAFAARGPSPSEGAIASELEDLVRRAMAMLPEDHREVLRLVREERLSLAEAAKRMGRSYEAVKKLHGRALFRFTEVFKGLRGGDDA